MSTKLLTTATFAEEVGLTRKRINQLITSGEIHAEKLGRDWLIEPKYIKVVKSRPEKRGRPKGTKNKEKAA